MKPTDMCLKTLTLDVSFLVVTHVHVTGVCWAYVEVIRSSYQANIAFLYLSYTHCWSRRGRDRMVVGFKTIYTISAYRLWFCSVWWCFRIVLAPISVVQMINCSIYVINIYLCILFPNKMMFMSLNLWLVVGWCPSRIQPKNIKLIIADSPLSTACSIKELEQRLFDLESE